MGLRYLVSPVRRLASVTSGGRSRCELMEEGRAAAECARRPRKGRRHAPLAIAGAAALLATVGIFSRTTSDEPRRLSEIGNCLTSSSCPDVWEPVCAARRT